MLEIELPHIAHTQRVVAVERPHVAHPALPLSAELPHVAFAQRVVAAELPHLADTTGRIRTELPHVAQSVTRLELELPHWAESGPESAPIQILPLGPEMGVPYAPPDPGAVPGLFNINLLTGLYRPWVKVHGPISGKVATADLQTKINGGWTGNVAFLGLKDLEFSEEGEFRIEMSDGAGGYLLSPPMVAESRDGDESFSGPVTSLSLMDRTSFRLSQTGRSLATFVRMGTREILAAIADEWNVSIAGAPDFPVLEEDVKDSSGWDPILRYAAVAAKHVLVDPDGVLRFVDCWQTGPRVSMRCTNVNRKVIPSLKYTGFSAVKTSTMPPGGLQSYSFNRQGFASFALKSPLRNPIPTNRSVRGGLRYLALWAGEPSAASSKLVAFHLMGGSQVNLSIPVHQGLVVTHATVAVVPAQDNRAQIDARLDLFGAPPEPPYAGTDAAFVVKHGVDGGRRTQIWREQTLPSAAYVEARIPRYLWEASKRSRPLSYRGRCDLRVRPTTKLIRAGHASNRAEEVSHRFTAGSIPETSVQAFYL